MKATALMCTYGRHNFVERSVRMFLEQDYENKHLVIFQNSPVFQTMDQEYFNRYITSYLLTMAIE
jgi:hypothetical protein